MNVTIDQKTTEVLQTTTPQATAAVASNIICLKPMPSRPVCPAINHATALLANQSLTIPDELIQGLLHKATKGVLAGSSKTSKTWILLDLAICVSTGARFIKWNTTQGKVLFVNMEIDLAFLKQRLQTLVEKKGCGSLDDLHFLTLRGRSDSPEELLETIAQRAQGDDYALIILDPIYKLMVGRSENTAKGVGLLCHHIEQLLVKTGAAVVYTHHFTKGSQAGKKAMDRLSGSGVFARDADTILTLTEHKEENCYNVEMILRNLQPQAPFIVEWQFPVMVERTDLKPDLTEDEVAEDNLVVDLLALLEEKPLTSSEWQKTAGTLCKRATFYRKLKTIKNAGKASLDDTTKTWTKMEDEADETGDTDETSDTDETCGTGETTETAPDSEKVPAIEDLSRGMMPTAAIPGAERNRLFEPESPEPANN
jgi:hypothetical protein